MTKATATTETPAKAKKPAKAAAVNKTPDAAKPAQPAKRTRKPATPKVETVEKVATPAPVAVPVAIVPPTQAVPATPAKRGVGRPLSADANKVRRRVLGAFQKLAATGEVEVTVKETARAVKLKKVTVSNTIRWAESEGIITRIGYKLKAGPGRKEVFYKLDPVKLAEAATAA